MQENNWNVLNFKFTVDCWSFPCWLLIVDLPLINSQQCWLSIGSLLIVDPLCWLDHQSTPDQQSTVLIVNWLTVDCWPSLLTWLSIGSLWLLTLSVDCWSPQDQHLTVFIVSHLTVDCWPSLLTVDCWLVHCWLLTLSVDCWFPPRINSEQCWLSIIILLTFDPLCWLLIVSVHHL